MPRNHQSLLGVGVYTVPEVARLTQVPPETVRRWVTGYSYKREGEVRQSPPLWERQFSAVDGAIALGFRDLLEVRFVQFFRSHGVSWKRIKTAAECAAEIVEDPHPFSTRRFKTDGRSIFADIARRTGEDALLNLVSRQYEIRSVFDPYLFAGIEFADLGSAPIRWWPLGRERRVVIDPQRAFGQPICDPESVPTSVLERAFRAEGSVEVVASWYDVAQESVQDAVEFERQLKAA